MCFEYLQMTKIYIFLLLIVLGLTSAFSQQVVWKAGVHSFFDNNEFSGSQIQTSQTMAGVHLAPQIGLSFENKHYVFAGINAMHEFGSNKAVDYYNLIAYYRFDQKPFVFYMGAFPKKPALERYPRMFFQDSINNYRPTINGFFWEYYSPKNNYMNVWLDWTGRQTETQREAFFMGWSGRYNFGAFYGQHFGYMFHLANSMNPEINEGVCDNGLVLTSLGLDIAEKTNFEKLEINAGWSVNMQRERSVDNEWHNQQGFLCEAKVEYKGIGLFNTYYKGQKQQTFYRNYGNALYWGDPIYRADEYNRLDAYICFVKNKAVSVQLTYSLHFAEQNMYHTQALYATFDLDNLPKKERKSYSYIWDNWFK